MCDHACVYAYLCVFACMCMLVYVCVRACVYVRMEGRKKYVWADPPCFCDSVLFAECLPHVHNDY